MRLIKLVCNRQNMYTNARKKKTITGIVLTGKGPGTIMSARSVNQEEIGMMQSKMKKLGLICMLVLAVCGTAAAQNADAPKAGAEKIIVNSNAAYREMRNYKVQVNVGGKVPGVDSGQPKDINVSYSFKLAHNFLRREGEGMLPMEISVKEANISSDGEQLTVSPATFPKLTAMLDRQWRINKLFGVAGSSYEKNAPGINYGNLIMLFILHGGDKPHAIGETWRERFMLPCYPETYDYAITIKSVDELNGMKVAAVHEDISWVTDKQSARAATVKASADSEFSIADGRLMKSHVNCNIQYAQPDKSASSQQDSQPCRANIKLDILAI